MPDFSELESSNWALLSPTQRVEALQQIENMMAGEVGRQPRTVTPEVMGANFLGAYDPSEPDKLSINSDLIQTDAERYWAAETVIHEGRHAYQDDCILKKIPPQLEDIDKVESWAHNMPFRGGYYESGGGNFIVYRYQPIEADANNYAKEQIDARKSFYQNDPDYKQFSSERDLEDRQTSADAKLRFGDDYEQTIAQSIESRYQALKSPQQRLSDMSRDSLSIKDPSSKYSSPDKSSKGLLNDSKPLRTDR